MKLRTIDWVMILVLAGLYFAWPQRGELMVIAATAKQEAARLSEECG